MDVTDPVVVVVVVVVVSVMGGVKVDLNRVVVILYLNMIQLPLS